MAINNYRYRVKLQQRASGKFCEKITNIYKNGPTSCDRLPKFYQSPTMKNNNIPQMRDRRLSSAEPYVLRDKNAVTLASFCDCVKWQTSSVKKKVSSSIFTGSVSPPPAVGSVLEYISELDTGEFITVLTLFSSTLFACPSYVCRPSN